MRFEGRELKPYAEPVSASELKNGSIYFSLNYADEEMVVPILEPLVFVGRNLEPGEAGRVYFQDVDSYRRGVRYDSVTKDDDATFWSGSENEISHIFEYDRALDQLLLCSLRRRKARAE